MSPRPRCAAPPAATGWGPRGRAGVTGPRRGVGSVLARIRNKGSKGTKGSDAPEPRAGGAAGEGRAGGGDAAMPDGDSPKRRLGLGFRALASAGSALKQRSSTALKDRRAPLSPSLPPSLPPSPVLPPRLRAPAPHRVRRGARRGRLGKVPAIRSLRKGRERLRAAAGRARDGSLARSSDRRNPLPVLGAIAPSPPLEPLPLERPAAALTPRAPPPPPPPPRGSRLTRGARGAGAAWARRRKAPCTTTRTGGMAPRTTERTTASRPVAVAAPRAAGRATG